MDLDEAMARIEVLERELDWVRQTVHRAHHEGPLDECPKNTCDAALKALGKRASTTETVMEFTERAEVVELDGENEEVTVEVCPRFEEPSLKRVKVPREALKQLAMSDVLYRDVEMTVRFDKVNVEED